MGNVMGMWFPKQRAWSVLTALSQAGIACSTLLAATVARAEFDVSVGIGAGYSDNIVRSETGERDEKIGAALFDVNWREHTRRLDADVQADLSYFEYLDDAFDSEVVGIADGLVTVQLVPEAISWLFQDSFGQAQSDPFVPVTPLTRENLNYFTTGPDFFLRFGNVGALRLFGRYSRTDYERSLLDADRTSAGIGLIRQSSGRGEISLNALTERNEFKQEVNPDYDRENVFLRYELQGRRTELVLDAGYTWLERENDERTGGALVNLIASRDISTSSTVSVRLGTQLTDAGEALRGSLGHGGTPGVGVSPGIGSPGVGGSPEITASSDPFENRSAGLEWRFARNRTTFTLNADRNEDSYETQTQLDRTYILYEAQFTRQLTRSLNLGLLASLSNEKFDNVELDADEMTMGADLTWRPGRHVGFTLAVDRIDRDTSTAFGEFTENRAFLTVTYRPREPSAAPLPRR